MFAGRQGARSLDPTEPLAIAQNNCESIQTKLATPRRGLDVFIGLTLGPGRRLGHRRRISPWFTLEESPTNQKYIALFTPDPQPAQHKPEEFECDCIALFIV